jgi:predicted DNA-binding ribbon-helix-helix protein
MSELVREIDDKRQQGNLSSAIRSIVLDCFKTTASRADPNDNQSHRKADTDRTADHHR